MTLAELITSDPANAAKTDSEVLAWLNASVAVFRDVSWLDFSMWVSEYNYRPTLSAAVASGTNAQKTAAQFMLDTIASGQPLYTSDSRVRAVLAKALPTGAERDALLALATYQAPRYLQAVSFLPLLGDVIAARA